MNRLFAVALCLLIPSLSVAADDSIKDLKKQRLALLVKVFDVTRERHLQEPNVVSFDQLHRAKVDIFAARLDLADTKEEQIKVCEEMLKYAEEWERVMALSKKNGIAAPVDALKAQAFVLEAKIALAKAKAAK